jgi:hypothetical protein
MRIADLNQRRIGMSTVFHAGLVAAKHRGATCLGRAKSMNSRERARATFTI